MTKKEIIFGRKPIIEALNSGTPIDKIVLLRGITSGYEIKTIRNKCKELNISLQNIPIEKFEYTVKKYFYHENINHQGVMAFLSPVKFYKVDDVLNQVYEAGKVPLFLILDGITDTRNFGAIARTAECFGVDAIIVNTKYSSAIDGNTVKTSAGAVMNIPVCKEPLSEVVKYFKLSGIKLIGTHLEAAKEIHQVDFTVPMALVLGSEGKGMSYEIEEACDDLCRIYTPGKTESLNVSVSCGVVLYEVLRQRG